ncbi:hypothetical protein ACFRH4_50655, partial [Streptomyces mirabilis]|uniref:hypothetical protein n=1 Tax=Streptomyces mirabilis TaxID=68239 RepID=UPI0036BEE1A5
MKQQQVSVAHHQRPVARGEPPSMLNVSTLGPIVASAVTDLFEGLSLSVGRGWQSSSGEAAVDEPGAA